MARFEPNRTGGGWSFQDNLYSSLSEMDVEFTDYENSEIYFISSPSMVQRDEVKKAKSDSKKIVLRLDNAVRNSRNRNTGMTRMYDFAQWADLIIYQSSWAKDYLKPFLKKDGIIILNGIDTKLFKPSSIPPHENAVLYSRFNRDETKNYEVARYWFSRFAEKHSDARLIITGQFSNELREGNFDFYNQENFRYLGVLDKNTMADVYRQCGKFLYTYYNDACSNTLIEALCSGCEIVGDKYYRNTGGASDILSVWNSADDFDKARRFFSRERMAMEYKEAMNELL